MKTRSDGVVELSDDEIKVINETDREEVPSFQEDVPKTFVFRGFGPRKDQVVNLPPQPPGCTALVLEGIPYADQYGGWDLGVEPWKFVWEDPAHPMPKLNRCIVTGDGCEDANRDLGYCLRCPGVAPETLAFEGLSFVNEE